MLRIRTSKTKSGKTAVQVVESGGHKITLVKHIGSAGTPVAFATLEKLAQSFIDGKSQTETLFPDFDKYSSHLPLISPDNLVVEKVERKYAYEVLEHFYHEVGFGKLEEAKIKDLCIARLLKPASKRQSLEFIVEHFGIRYSLDSFYKTFKKISAHKSLVETIATNYAVTKMGFDFCMVFYDVTTLYFESFKDDELRRPGFSKDGKSQQPQIVIGLVVTPTGFPVAYEVYEGNKFEGHTIIPVIKRFVEKFKVKSFTVVADAGMLSLDNILELQAHNLNYIVAARLSYLNDTNLKKISEFLSGRENIYYAQQNQYGKLICDYSKKRALKDKSDRNKQIERANRYISNPSGSTKTARFVKTVAPLKYEINTHLIAKDELMDGIKGYYTNLPEDIPHEFIVSKYKELWRVERAFRMSKHDLEARPIYHFKKQSVESHILIVFIAMCVGSAIESQTKQSLKHTISKIWRVYDITFKDSLSGYTFTKRSDQGVQI